MVGAKPLPPRMTWVWLDTLPGLMMESRRPSSKVPGQLILQYASTGRAATASRPTANALNLVENMATL